MAYMTYAHIHHDRPKNNKGATVLAVLPTTLDTPANRAAMPGADFGGWTKVCLYGSVCVWLVGCDD